MDVGNSSGFMLSTSLLGFKCLKVILFHIEQKARNLLYLLVCKKATCFLAAVQNHLCPYHAKFRPKGITKFNMKQQADPVV